MCFSGPLSSFYCPHHIWWCWCICVTTWIPWLASSTTRWAFWLPLSHSTHSNALWPGVYLCRCLMVEGALSMSSSWTFAHTVFPSNTHTHSQCSHRLLKMFSPFLLSVEWLFLSSKHTLLELRSSMTTKSVLITIICKEWLKLRYSKVSTTCRVSLSTRSNSD